MRKWINLVESATAAWPDEIEGWDLAQRVAEFHHSPEDFDEGDIEQNISAFGTYHLQQYPLSKLERGLFTIDDDLVASYAGRTSAAPPIVVDPTHGWVIDGNHRVEAAVNRGEETITAYVADPSTYEAPDDDDDDDDDDDLYDDDDDDIYESQSSPEIKIGNETSFALGNTIDTNSEDLVEWFEDMGLDEDIIPGEINGVVAILFKVEVAREDRGLGKGGLLLEAFCREARNRGATAVLLEANTGIEQQNGFDLVEWYESNGFEIIIDREDPVMMRTF
jgi:GNAT superfamily N-acetyltransferase